MSFLSKVAQILACEVIWCAVAVVVIDGRLYVEDEASHGGVMAMCSSPRDAILFRKPLESRTHVPSSHKIAPRDADNHLWRKDGGDGQLQGLESVTQPPSNVTPKSG